MKRVHVVLGALACSILTLSACGSGGSVAGASATGHAGAAASAGAGTVAIDNCGQQETFPSPAKRIYVYDSGLIAMTLAVGADKQIAAAAAVTKDGALLKQLYGPVVDSLPDTGEKYPTLEGVLAQRPDVMIAGYNYGFSESRNLMPEMLKGKGIAPYILTESCRQKAGQAQRGLMDPWAALRTDLTNLAKITGHEDNASRVIKDIDQRLDALRKAPKAERKPVVLLFDSGKDTVFTSGSFGGPHGIIDVAGATNLAEDVKDTWTKISWEKVAQAKPDFITFVNYGTTTMADKIKLLESNPATRDLPAVTQKRYLNMGYGAWVSSPINIDAAENLRVALERANLLPASGITPKHNIHVAN